MKLSKKLYVTLKERLLQNPIEILLKTLKFEFVCVFVIVRDALSCFKEGFYYSVYFNLAQTKRQSTKHWSIINGKINEINEACT